MFAPPHSFSVRALDKKQQQPEGHDCVFVAKGERSRCECAGMRGRSLTWKLMMLFMFLSFVWRIGSWHASSGLLLLTQRDTWPEWKHINKCGVKNTVSYTEVRAVAIIIFLKETTDSFASCLTLAQEQTSQVFIVSGSKQLWWKYDARANTLNYCPFSGGMLWRVLKLRLLACEYLSIRLCSRLSIIQSAF